MDTTKQIVAFAIGMLLLGGSVLLIHRAGPSSFLYPVKVFFEGKSASTTASSMNSGKTETEERNNALTPHDAQIQGKTSVGSESLNSDATSTDNIFVQ